MLKIYLYENETKNQVIIEKLIKEIISFDELDMELRCSTNDKNKLLGMINGKNSCSIYFISVNLKGNLEGLKIAREIREVDPNGFIILTTSNTENLHLAFLYRLEVMDFILKDNYAMMRKKIQQCLIDSQKRYLSQKDKSSEILTVKTSDSIRNFKFKDILFIETSSIPHKLILHTMDYEVEFYGKIKELLNILDSRFKRIHNSYLVNIENIKKIDKSQKIVYMNNGEICLGSARLFKNII